MRTAQPQYVNNPVWVLVEVEAEALVGSASDSEGDEIGVLAPGGVDRLPQTLGREIAVVVER